MNKRDANQFASSRDTHTAWQPPAREGRRWLMHVILGLAILLLERGLHAQPPAAPDLAREIINAMTKAPGYKSGYRPAHAKGIVAEGIFTPSAEAATISRAAHFAGASVPVTVRLSASAADPAIADGAPQASPRGMAIRFKVGAGTDIVAISHNGFLVGTGEEFLELLQAQAATDQSKAHPWPIETFLSTHSNALKFVQDPKPAPVSYATESFFANNAFRFVNQDGIKRAGRYQIVPVAGPAYLNDEAAKGKSHDYLAEELKARLAQGPVKFRLLLQLAAAGDRTSDSSIVWPEDRKKIDLGTIALTSLASGSGADLAFDPARLTGGIELSDDPLPLLRSRVYALSAAIRHQKPQAAGPSLPSAFLSRTVATPEGANIFVRYGGRGPAALLIHGYTETGDMWGPLARTLAKTHTVIIPDLRGLGGSSTPDSGYDKKTQARDIRAVVTALGYDRTAVVGHDIGNMVSYAYAAQYPDKVERLIVMDAPIPGIDPWDSVVRSRALWHFSFGGPDAERLVQGRERIYLDRIWNEFAADPAKMDEATRAHYAAQYAQPGRMRAGFAQFAALAKDEADNKDFQRTKLTMPVLAIGGEKSFGSLMAANMRNVATDVREAVVPGAGHWLIEENEAYTLKLIADFLDSKTQLSEEIRIAPGDFRFPGGAGAGTSGAPGIQSVTLKGHPERAGLYTILLRIPANTRIQSHRHSDERVATVISGTWYIGYGDTFTRAALKALPPGSFYSEPAGDAHYAETRAEPVIVQITGFGPTNTQYIESAFDPRPASASK